MIKAIWEKPTAKITFNGKRLKALPWDQEWERIPVFTTSIQHRAGRSSQSKKRKENKKFQLERMK
jgi:hypothetical protein